MTDTNPAIRPAVQTIVREVPRCEACGSTHTIKLATREGRLEYRRCQTCYKTFRVLIIANRNEAT